jgi:hypothetical protein
MAMVKRIAAVLGFALAGWVCAEVPAHAQAWAIACTTPGQVLTSPNGFVQLTCGNSPNLMAIPHDGGIAPSTMSSGTSASCTPTSSFSTGTDGTAAEVAGYVAQSYFTQSGKYLWRVRSLVRRDYLDVSQNDKQCATGDDPEAGRTYDYYYQALEYARARLGARGFLWDLHSNGAHDFRIELGFGISRTLLYDPEEHAHQTSLHAFAATHEGSFTTLLRDLGTRFRQAGYAAIPSESAWEPEPEDLFYQGGGFVLNYGCQNISSNVCAVQVEMHKGMTRYTDTQQKAFAATFARIMREYLAQFGVTW